VPGIAVTGILAPGEGLQQRLPRARPQQARRSGRPAGPMRARRLAALAAEVTISYGDWPADAFFLAFGFLPPPSRHDSAVLFADLRALVDAHDLLQVPHARV